MFERVLYLSAFRPASWASAVGLADAVILDLEASTPEEGKLGSRAHVVERLATGPRLAARQGVRVNAAGSSWFADDVEACRSLADFIVIPRVESSTDIAAAAALAPGIELWAMLENARIIAGIDELVDAEDGLAALVLGYLDLTRDLSLPFDPTIPQIRALSISALEAAKVRGIRILDGVYPGNPVDALAAIDVAEERGFSGATYISAEVLGLHRLATSGILHG